MHGIRASFSTVCLIACFACNRGKENSGVPQAAGAAPRSPTTVSRFAATGWPDDAGAVIVLPASQPGKVQLILPELTDSSLTDTSSFILDSLPGARVQLFSREKIIGLASVSEGEAEESLRGCRSWPTARLAQSVAGSWKFGLAENVASELPLRSWGRELAGDSVEAASAALGIVTGLKGDSVFRGIPFYLRFLYRLELGASRALVADAVRRINTEANVREEHVLLIAERQGGSRNYVPAFRQTRTGGEDDVQVPEVIGALRLGENRRPALLISLEYSEGSRLLLLERMAIGRWAVRWRSAYSGC